MLAGIDELLTGVRSQECVGGSSKFEAIRVAHDVRDPFVNHECIRTKTVDDAFLMTDDPSRSQKRFLHRGISFGTPTESFQNLIARPAMAE